MTRGEPHVIRFGEPTIYIYFIECGDGGPIKIGQAIYPRLRMDDLQIGSPFQLRLLGVILQGRWTEIGLHLMFAQLRMRGEWFRPSPELLAFIGENAQSGFPVQGALPLKVARSGDDDIRHLGMPGSIEGVVRMASISSISYLYWLMEKGRLTDLRHVGVRKAAVIEQHLRTLGR